MSDYELGQDIAYRKGRVSLALELLKWAQRWEEEGKPFDAVFAKELAERLGWEAL